MKKTDHNVLPKNFSPSDFEAPLYESWKRAGYFGVSNDDPRPAFTIVIPPPNVTGALHMGHALDHTLQDILVRFKRMDGFATLWLPGTDHAGIATQNVVERELESQGLTREALGRVAFVEKVWEWKEKYGSKIMDQIARLGDSCDWSRERFTLDAGLSQAVRKAFVSLYQEGLIYRSSYLVNWDPKNQTAISDLEVEFFEVQGSLTHFQYPLEDGSAITVATTRPETMLGDTAIAVHPDDERYQKQIGKFARHPFLDRKIPIIADTYVKKEFGSGAVKITPAHDPNDYEMGLRHNLPMITILDKDGTLNEHAGPYKGLTCAKAREKIIQDLKNKNLFVKSEDHLHMVGHSQRSGAVIEPLISKQWFVKTKPLAEKATKAVQSGQTQFVPDMWNKTYFQWMDQIRDWCISRQLWWGHQIPVWYCADCDHQTVSLQDPTVCEKCQSSQIEQDPDVLDTWFSSALWPFSTLGWPENTKDLEKFYPTQVLVTGFDIIFFWVARMMMMGMKFMNQVPFEKVHIHALVRDEQGQKMSKSKGNVIDPLKLIDQYGADALRFGLCALSVQGRDILLSEKRIEGSRNFINKLWNAGKFIEHILGSDKPAIIQPDQPQLLINQWILHRLSEVVKEVRFGLEEMKFNEVADVLYRFTWNEFCDCYIDFTKVHLYGDDTHEKQETLNTFLFTFDQLLRLLHPIMPFVTEALWTHFAFGKDSIMIQSFPKPHPIQTTFSIQDVSHFQEVITKIRTIRSQHTILPSKKISIHIWNKTDSKKMHLIQKLEHYLKPLANAENVNYEAPFSNSENIFDTCDGTEIAMSLAGLVDPVEEKNRLQKELEKAQTDIAFLQNKLQNKAYMAKAPAQLVSETQEKLTLAQQSYGNIKEQLEKYQ